MSDLRPLLNWIFTGNSTFTKLYIGKHYKIINYDIEIIESYELIYNKVERYCKEKYSFKLSNNIKDILNTCVEVMIYSDCNESIIRNFKSYKNKMRNILVECICINERFLDSKCKIFERKSKILNDQINNDEQNFIKKHFQSYGTSIIVKIKYIVLVNYLEEEKETVVLKSALASPSKKFYGTKGIVKAQSAVIKKKIAKKK